MSAATIARVRESAQGVGGGFASLAASVPEPAFMNDYFAVLNEGRRPWIDPDLLKQKFLTLSAQVHPDRVHNASEAEKRSAQQRYTDLNSAYNCLRDSKARL